MMFSLVACGEAKSTEEEPVEYEIALVAGMGSIRDGGFNQAAWEGITQFANENGKSYKYYRPDDGSQASYVRAIDAAVRDGGKIIVAAGSDFSGAIYTAQKEYSASNFILIDSIPKEDGGGTGKVEKNTVAITFAEEESGYLAGYAAVKDGYKKLGFIGGVPMPSVIRYGHGFLQGANAAAEELGVSGVSVRYAYMGSFDATPQAEKRAQGWYKSGTQVIFAGGGQMVNSIMNAAEQKDKKVIGIDTDQSEMSETVITSATKDIKKSVDQQLDNYYNDEFPSGTAVHLDVANQGISLPMESSKFKTFTEKDYETILEKIKMGEVKINKNHKTKISQLDLPNITVKEAK